MKPSSLLNYVLFLSTPYFVFELIGVKSLVDGSAIAMITVLFLIIYLGASVVGYLVCIQLVSKNLAAFGMNHIMTKRVVEGLIWGLLLLFFFYYVDNSLIVLGLIPALFIAAISDFIFKKLLGSNDQKVVWIKYVIWMAAVIFASIILSYLLGHFLLLQDFISSEMLVELMINRERVPFLYAFFSGFMGFIVCLTLMICQEYRLKFGICLLDDFFREL